MGYRQIFIKKSEKLSYKDNQLVVLKDNIDTKVPLEDVNYILLEDTTTILTSRLLSEIGKNAIALIICDETHEPESAAKMYFRSLFGSNFVRHFDDGTNNALNYGYTILTSCLIRQLSTYGLLTYYGINHKSKTNNFNLAYDLVEPFRPIVDKFVFEHRDELSDDLTFDVRKELVNLLNYEVIVEEKRYTVEYAMELLVKSYIKALTLGEVSLSLPQMIRG